MTTNETKLTNVRNGEAARVEAILARLERLSLAGKLEMLNYIRKNYPEKIHI